MKTSNQWILHFQENAKQHRIDWSLRPDISEQEISTILASLQAWQLGETSDGRHLLKAVTRYARQINDLPYIEATALFIKEEQKHGNNLGTYLDRIGKPRIKADLGDTLFRKVRYFNANMEIWTLTVIVVESTAQIFYQSMKDATRCKLLKQICTDILIDEAPHITFQTERLSIIFNSKSAIGKAIALKAYHIFYFSTALVVWMAHKKLFRAGGNTFTKYMIKMRYKYNRIIRHITTAKVAFESSAIAHQV
ncbi:ferritin-like domain-containing protein [Chitinophaga filiformis]|uniref:Ferritin-like domain-containing protein n=1 Tax=Chitinophaga filiformis TaxID=104663 RepID=A0ABY4I6K6_CHIFI|nr:ferritin-like domain-containing protein [Chitinophaga filiformis]UPK71718.1 ferritin-like domain-containing protein [Chitinophaga filiformis]